LSPSNFQHSASSHFVTFEKSHPQFQDYLLGSFSQDQVALPVTTLYVNSPNEKVTFQILSKQDLQRPTQARIAAQVLRLDILSLTLAPVLVFWIHSKNQFINSGLAIWAILALLFLHGAVFCRNDYMDHIRGVDRCSENGGSRVIQRGWLKAITVQKIYRILFICTLLLAAPVFVAKPELLGVALTTSFIGVWGYSYLRAGRGLWWLSSIVVFLCLGPFLTGAFSWLLTEAVTVPSLVFGCYFGALAVLYMLLRHVIGMVADDEAGIRTLPVRLGFDRIKILLFILVILTMVQLAWSVSWLKPSPVSLLALPLLGWMTFFARRIFALSSPLSSGLFELPKELVKIQIASGLLFAFFSFI